MIPIDYNFTSKINELEDIFLGKEVEGGVFVERLFYERTPSQDAREEIDYKEKKRIRKYYDYKEDVDNDFYVTNLNYDEIDFQMWESMLSHYEIYIFTDFFNEDFECIDNYLANENVDWGTKCRRTTFRSFSRQYAYNRQCVSTMLGKNVCKFI